MGTPHARAFVFIALLGIGGCGGAGDGPPGPLARHFDEMKFLGGIPVDQRQEELDAKREYDEALMLQAKAHADDDAAKVLLDVAKNERDAAKLDEKSAQSRQKAAQQSADTNRIKESETEMKGARLAADAADKRWRYINAYRTWLKRVIRYTEHNTFWKEAKYELAQAKIAQKNTIAPAGFNYDNFVKQEADRAKKVTEAKARADNEKKNAIAARTSWLALQKESDKLLGRTSDYPDPLDPANVQGVPEEKGYTVGGDGGSGDDGGQPVQDPTMKDSPAPPPPDDMDEESDDEDSADPDEGGE